MSSVKYRFFYVLLLMPLMVTASWSQNISYAKPDTTIIGKPPFKEGHIDSHRLKWLLGGASVTYVGSSIALYKTWYQDFPRSGFHLHNDLEEWRYMDKLGHVYAGYFQTDLAYKGLLWTGMQQKKALLYGSLSALLSQTTIEVMDGFSTEWGFSLSDMGANVVGIGTYVLQENFWGEQRLRWKNSYTPVDYQEPLLDARVSELYGNGFFQRWLKDYNGQTSWLSINIDGFLPSLNFPSWLNIAVGYGAENMYGGYMNDYGAFLPSNDFDLPRYSQFYLSLDADLSKIETSSSFIRTLLDILNVFKIPFSMLEINTLGEVKFHLLRF